ncbi:hypothetical protein DPMN_033323 [Dreissena polymorpha]|uniref:Uncharacterized protein n=1 Tax=Dreissena polymorpha TaxID=45954 RepID=A0A9D4M5U4_DREPO|nr:hypothetical protein DPMN_061757 [Dreissena polymorpha]KAH3870141.1 hypothetical protein DPMN_033323 [Dreissena polymorpha]
MLWKSVGLCITQKATDTLGARNTRTGLMRGHKAVIERETPPPQSLPQKHQGHSQE